MNTNEHSKQQGGYCIGKTMQNDRNPAALCLQ